MFASSQSLGLTVCSARPGVAIAFVAAALLGLTGCERKEQQPVAEGPQERPRIGILPENAPQPDIVMILVDALRADRLGAYGHGGGLSPTMDSIAAEGVTFNYCVSAAPWTLPSVATMFTSYYPRVHRALSYRVVADMEKGKQAEQSVLSDEFDTLAEVLQANGYQTAGFCAAKFLREQYGFGQGFEHYDTSFAENTVRGELVNAALFEWLEKSRDASRPLLLYLHYMDVHGPYDAAPRFMDPLMKQVEANPNKQLLESRQFRAINAYLRRPPRETSDPDRFEQLKGYREYWIARYEAGVAEMDFYLSQLIEHLRELGIWDQAYVILLADHGEALCEHDIWDHGYSQYQTDLHVPLILRWPGVLPAGKRVRWLASLIDILPTLLEQLRLPPGQNLQGVSLVDHVSDRPAELRPMRYAEGLKAGPAQYALFVDSTKLMVTEVPVRETPDRPAGPSGVRPQLFNLATDPGEQYDVSDQHRDVVNQMTKLMSKIMQTNMNLKPGLVVPTAAVDDTTMQQLASLGYVGDLEEEEEANDVPETQPTTAPGTRPDESEGEPNDNDP